MAGLFASVLPALFSSPVVSGLVKGATKVIGDVIGIGKSEGKKALTNIVENIKDEGRRAVQNFGRDSYEVLGKRIQPYINQQTIDYDGFEEPDDQYEDLEVDPRRPRDFRILRRPSAYTTQYRPPRSRKKLRTQY